MQHFKSKILEHGEQVFALNEAVGLSVGMTYWELSHSSLMAIGRYLEMELESRIIYLFDRDKTINIQLFWVYTRGRKK
jgi:hypothetical protein